MRWTRANAAAVIMPLLLALGLRLYELGAKPLWFDEVITHKRALLPLPQLITDALINKHIPTYFLLVRPFDAPLIDEALLRLPSAIFGSLAVGLVALIATEFRSPRAGFVAGVLMALSPIEVQFSQEARAYALLSCLVLLALWGLLRIAQPPAGTSGHGTRAGFIAYALGTIGALNVLVAAVFWWLASNLAMLFVLLRPAARRTELLRPWLIAQGVIALAWLPALIGLALDSHPDPLRGYHWIPASTLQHVGAVLSAVYLFVPSDMTTFALLPVPVPWLGLIVVAFAVFGLWQLRRAPSVLAPVALAAFAMPVAMLAISLFHPFWIPRYLLWGTGAFYVLAGIGVAALPRRLFVWTAAALIAGGAGNLAAYYKGETKPRWDLAARYLASHAQPADAIATNGYAAKYVLSAYAARYHLDQRIVDAYNGAPALKTARPARVWVVFGRVGQASMAPPQEYLDKWSSLGPPAATRHFGQHVIIWRFERER